MSNRINRPTTPIRQAEQAILHQMLHAKKAEFLALYGRRRVGKTHLIREYCSRQKNTTFFDVAGAKDSPMSQQIQHFTRRLGEVFYQGATLELEKNWEKTFQRLTHIIDQHPKDKPLVLFFDEFPWMVTKNSRLLQTLDYYWNQYWSKNPCVKLIICGSCASWIIDKIVNNKAGLHNRITRHIHLEPFNLSQVQVFLAQQNVKLSIRQILPLYMVTGGIPYYLMHIQPGQSAAQAIDQIAFKKQGVLLNEFNNLFQSLFDDHQIYEKIVRFIAQHRYGVAQATLFNTIDKTLKGKKGQRVLTALEDTGFIIRLKPHQHARRGIYYKVIDEYTLFYLHWIEPVKNTLLRHNLDHGYWQLQQQSPAWQSWSAYAFEAVCYKHISQIKQALQLLPTDIPNTWRYAPPSSKNTHNPEHGGAQIDLLFDRQDNAITLCEIKYTDKPFSIDKSYAKNLQNKQTIFKSRTRTTKELFMVLISANGIKNNLYADDLITATVTLEDLFK